MVKVTVDKTKFEFKYLPAYADYLLKNHLEEYVKISIRFCREVDLPMLKPLAKMPEKDLINLSIESNKITLNALRDSTIAEHIEENLTKWVENKLGFIDRSAIAIEDLSLAYYIKRKTFSYFLYGYTQSAAVQQLIINEVDAYTSQEELISLKAYIEMQKEIN